MKTCIDRRIDARIAELKRQRDVYNALLYRTAQKLDCWGVRYKCAAAELWELEKVQVP